MDTIIFFSGIIGLGVFITFILNLFFEKEARKDTHVQIVFIFGIIALAGGTLWQIISPLKCVSADKIPEYYRATTMQIVEIDEKNDIVFLSDANGFRWQTTGVEDYYVGDLVSCVMYTQGTLYVFDDEIVEMKFSGYSINQER